jgi:hypothetical protein
MVPTASAKHLPSECESGPRAYPVFVPDAEDFKVARDGFWLVACVQGKP